MSGPLFVAPHPDDIALSLGGAVATAARTSSPTILTVFAGRPGGDVSAFAEGQHARWGVTATDVQEVRDAEDVAAAREMGESVRLDRWEFLDAIYRDARYDSDDALFGNLLNEDLPLIEMIADTLAARATGAVFVPLGAGNHVDHQLVFRAGQRLATRGLDVWAYPDLPYALREPQRGLDRLAQRAGGEFKVLEMDDEAFQRKWRAIAAYPTQVPVIFRDFADPQAALEQYHRKLGGGRLAEVVWSVVPESVR